jgi:hypothetical protein
VGDSSRVTVVLGDEFDEALRAKLLRVLRDLDASVAGSGRRVIAGSQDFEQLDVVIEGQPLHVEAETYMGLSISGSGELVKRIQLAMTA